MAFSTVCDRQPSFRSPVWARIEAFAKAREAERARPPVIVEKDNEARRIARHQTAKNLLKFHRVKAALKKPRYREILEEVAQKHGFTVAGMLVPDRKQKFTQARFEASWRLFDETDMSLPLIGRRMGGRDHTTILHAIEGYMDRNGIAERPIHRRSRVA